MLSLSKFELESYTQCTVQVTVKKGNNNPNSTVGVHTIRLVFQNGI